MAKEVNIHVKTTGTEQAKQDFTGLTEACNSQLTSLRLLQFQATSSTKQHTDELKNQESTLGRLGSSVKNFALSWFSVTAVFALVVAGIRKVINAFDDMKKAAGEAMQKTADQQRAAASFFEAMDAYGGPQRKAALAMARGVQARTGLPFEESKQLLEAQKRTFGEINPEVTDQFAGYWRLHAGAATTDLIRWMGESGIKTPERQGQIMRMISAVSGKTGLKDEELIAALTAQGEKFRYLGWTPEQTIENFGKVLVPGAGTRPLRNLFGAIEGFTKEKAAELGAPSAVAADEQARWNWIQSRPELFHKAFGLAAPTMSRLFGPAAPITPLTAEEEQQRIAESLKTEEAKLEMGKGKGVQVEGTLTPEQQTKELIRKQGKDYLEFLRIHDRLKYEQIKATPGGEEYQYERAAELLWGTGRPKQRAPIPPVFIPGGGLPAEVGEAPATWQGVPPEERLAGSEKAAQNINIHYHNETIYTPRVGSDERGPRTPANIK